MLPEFACAQWLGFAPVGLPLDQQVPWLASLTEPALAALGPLPARYGVALLAGTMPTAVPDPDGGPLRHVNRAWLMTPEGGVHSQDKLCLTPSEQNPHAWLLAPGAAVNVITWRGLRIAVIVCLDVELTALWARLATLDLDLVLVPAKTDLLSGYYRVFGCAKARAIELQTVVCAVGAVGHPARRPGARHRRRRGGRVHPVRGQPRLHRRRGRARTARGERRTQPRALRLPAPGRPVPQAAPRRRRGGGLAGCVGRRRRHHRRSRSRGVKRAARGTRRTVQLSSLLTEPPPSRAPEPPATRLAAMLESDEVTLPAPGGGDTVARWAALARWGRADLPLGRLAEGHTDAVAILRELGARPHPHACYGVWAARPGGIGAELSGDPRRLTGTVRFCSGARDLDRALVVAAAPEGMRLVDLALDQPGVHPVEGQLGRAGDAGE